MLNITILLQFAIFLLYTLILKCKIANDFFTAWFIDSTDMVAIVIESISCEILNLPIRVFPLYCLRKSSDIISEPCFFLF